MLVGAEIVILGEQIGNRWTLSPTIQLQTRCIIIILRHILLSLLPQ